MSQNSPLTANSESGLGFSPCTNCHAPMPTELRFCRNCGYRLGEGSAEYNETRRFPAGAYIAPASMRAEPFGGPGGQVAPAAACGMSRRKKRFGGTGLIFIAIVFFFMVTGIATKIAPRQPAGGFGILAPPRSSYAGVSGFETTDGGVTFENVEPAGGPADKAGLVGGDVITMFDGKPVHSNDEMANRLSETPPGKTVDVVYLRDGETKTTKLTTVSKAEFDQLVAAFRHRPEGLGKLGINGQELVEVEVRGARLHGVKLGSVDPSMSAALAGLQNGDIVIEFAGKPIRTEEELSQRIHQAIPYSTVLVVVMRGSNRLEIPVKMGRR
jgi:membrane-associated protease RseP (regulator of RpoE activity)